MGTHRTVFFGNNTSGQLGLGNFESRSRPTKVNLHSIFHDLSSSFGASASSKGHDACIQYPACGAEGITFVLLDSLYHDGRNIHSETPTSSWKIVG